MSLVQSPSPSSSGFGLFGSSQPLISGGGGVRFGPVAGVGSGSAGAPPGGGYYSSIGGGAAPFGPALNMRSVKNAALLTSCARQMQRPAADRRKRRSISRWNNQNHNPAPAIDRHYRSSPADPIIRAAAGGGGITFRKEGSTRMGKLYCRSGYHLQIHKDGKVNGTRLENNRFGILEFLSIAFGLVSIKSKESDLYLCMNRRGRLYGSSVHTSECVFMEKMLENYYNTYTSCRYGRGRRSRKKWYVAINKRGRPKRGNQSRKKHRFTQFLVLHLDDDDYKWTRRKLVMASASGAGNTPRGQIFPALDGFRRWERIRSSITTTTTTVTNSRNSNSPSPPTNHQPAGSAGTDIPRNNKSATGTNGRSGI